MTHHAYQAPRGLVLVLGLLWLALSGCGSVIENPTPIRDLPPEASRPPERYRIQPGDELDVRFFHTPDLNIVAPVRPDGFISLPLANELRAAGRTAEELRADLTAAYAAELEDPAITVIVLTFTSYKVHVGGEVRQQSVYEITGQMRVLDAVFQAGGFLTSARLEEIVLIRKTPEDTYYVVVLDFEQVLNGEDLSQNLVLMPYDVIFVPRSPIGNVNVWVDLYLRQNIPISFGIRGPDLGN